VDLGGGDKQLRSHFYPASVVDPNPVECETFSRIRVLEKMRPDPSSSGKLVKFVTISQQNAQFKEINYRIFCQKNIPLKAYISY
jgi:hypothetical protein